MTKHLDADPENDPADDFDLHDLNIDEIDDDEEYEDNFADTCPVCQSVLDDDGDCPNPNCDASPYNA